MPNDIISVRQIDIPWSILPYRFHLSAWRFDDECGWLEYSLLPGREPFGNLDGPFKDLTKCISAWAKDRVVDMDNKTPALLSRLFYLSATTDRKVSMPRANPREVKDAGKHS